MPDDEGLALAHVASLVGSLAGAGQAIIEIGAYCGKSTLYLAFGILAAVETSGATVDPAGAETATVVFSIDHHHGSEENQAEWEHHDAALVDARTGRMDTLPTWRSTIEAAGVEDRVVAVVGDSPTIATRWTTPAGLVFIDGGHGAEPAWADYRGWAPKVAIGGWLAIHDVFPDPSDGGRAPYELYCQAVSSGAFAEDGDLGRGSLRVLQRVSEGI
jgi:predicted O-methyltransferase YrrM